MDVWAVKAQLVVADCYCPVSVSYEHLLGISYVMMLYSHSPGLFRCTGTPHLAVMLTAASHTGGAWCMSPHHRWKILYQVTVTVIT